MTSTFSNPTKSVAYFVQDSLVSVVSDKKFPTIVLLVPYKVGVIVNLFMENNLSMIVCNNLHKYAYKEVSKSFIRMPFPKEVYSSMQKNYNNLNLGMSVGIFACQS